MAVDFDKTNKIITVLQPATTITIQDLHDEIRLFEEKNQNLEVATVVNASGKQSLGGGVQVGITLELINDWRLAFEARPGPTEVLCTVSGGNLVATNIYSNNPIYPTAFVQVVIAQSSSATIITPPSDYAALYLIESLRGRHASIGDVWYWNPTTGNNTNDGKTPPTAVATFAQAQTLATAGNHDVIFALSTAAGGITTVTEIINISKATLKVRGPGFPFQFVPTSAGDVVTISAANIEFSGFYVSTHSTGTSRGVVVTNNNALVKDVWVKSTTGNGIDISSSARSRIDTCAVEDCAGIGVAVGAATNNLTIRQAIISGGGGDGIDLAGATVIDNVLENNLIYNNAGFGVDIGSGVSRTMVRLHHTFSGNTLGATRDLGSGTFIETPAGGASASSIADAVWDELISDHVAVGSTGKTLRDAKIKATLASLK